ncbi:DUF805 domain-containing protein [Helicobacter sp. MIT 05-5294]|uniref:DUF805 domain-containing protein n=1 Tax=Helicobacter sp. MIT 05-5294 TaxID=1548150 RepID=UPI0010FDDF6A|nr:DUF805 domain-containing protein [Helicobacter sp. MIT 05-5294]TLD85417.1 DUF805 domain-containing protein [Helicobacter sp. MIT 05-5294]
METIILIKKFYDSFILPPLYNTITFNFEAKLSRREYLVFWLSTLMFVICLMIFIIHGISFTRGLFRILFDIQYPKLDLGDLLFFYMFGCMVSMAVLTLPFFITTANRLKDANINAWILLPLFILMWLWGTNLLQFQYNGESTPLIYKILSYSLMFMLPCIILLAVFFPTKNKP